MSLTDAQGEVVYGSALGDDSHVMSERVQSLAASVYQEFERMIKKYDEDVVKELMPLVVGILETLDNVFVDKQENEVELELLRDDNEQLLTQYEREKQLRKLSEQKYLEVEDVVEEERRESQNKTESLESLVRLLELKARNSQDHVVRLEEKESEMKKEYTKLHERYTELFRTHMDHIERTKMFMGTEKILELGASPRTRGGFQMPSLRPVGKDGLFGAVTPDKISGSPPMFPSITSPGRGPDSNATLKHELKNLEKGEVEEKLASKERKELANKERETAEKEQNTDSIALTTTSTCMKPGSETSTESTENKTTAEIHTDTGKESSKTDSITSSDTTSANPSSDSLPSNSSDNNLTDLTLNVSKHDLETPKAAYSIGISVDPEDLEEDDTSVVPSADSLQSPEADDSMFDKSQAVGIAGKKHPNESSIFDELTMEDAHALGDVDDGCDITGMSKEVENLILENTELLATKNALNVVKDDLIAKVDELTSEQEILREEITSLQAIKEKLRKRVSELEDEVKRLKDDLEKEKLKKPGEGEEDEEVPMAQRKRFTRVEMARVLMERNQYKERLMELQEAVRWTEMIRASREHPDLVQRDKKKGSIWNFFSNLFSSNSSAKPSTKRPPHHPPTVKYSAPTTKVTPSGDPNKKQRENMNMGEKGKAYDFLQDDLLAEKARKEREKERREQYKQVRAHVKKDDGRMQAYGWSLPAKFSTPVTKETNKSQVPVPVPVYCRPLLEKDEGMKLWCAAGVNLTGGKTKDGGSIVGASVFYSDPPLDTNAKPPAKDEIDKLDQELQEHKRNLAALENMKLSSLVWICTTIHNSSQVTVVDANKPGDILETFHVTSSHILCIASVPGATESDYPSDSDPLAMELSPKKPGSRHPSTSEDGSQAIPGEGSDSSSVGGIRFVQCVTGAAGGSPNAEEGQSGGDAEGGAAAPPSESSDSVIDPDSEVKISRATGSPASSADSTPSHSDRPQRGASGGQSELIKDGVSSGPATDDIVGSEVSKMSSIQPTMWLGCQSGSLYVHSAVSQWKRCLHSVKLKDSVLNIVHLKGRVFVALADGSLAVFHRDGDGQWDLRNYHVVDLGKPQHSIRCVCVVGNKDIWCGYRNKIHVINPKSLKLEKTFDAHPRKESQVRQLAWVGDGVWVSIRLDSTLRLYHAYTHQHLQDVDIEPYVSKMLGTGKLGFSFVRITSLLASCNRLWIGTGNGVIISVPLSENNKQTMPTTAGRPGSVIRVYSDTKTDSVTPGSFLPYCTMAQAQLSFHGHRDAVKFFVAVPGAPSKGVSGVMCTQPTPKDSKSHEGAPDGKTEKKTMLVLSGGEGYIDFRIGDTEEEGEAQDPDHKQPEGISKGEKSHLIVWHLTGKWSH